MKRGFTLIELMAVIFILGVVGVISVIAVDKLLKDNKENLYKAQISSIEDAARTWGNANIKLIPDEKGGAISIPLILLKQNGLIDKNFKNPKNEELFYDNMYIDISYEDGVYVYDVIEDSGTENYLDSNGEVDLYYPSIILKEKFYCSSCPTSVGVYISSINKNIESKQLTSSNKQLNYSETYNGVSKTFTMVRKAKTA